MIRGGARSAPISPLIKHTFYQSMTANIGFVDYVRDCNPPFRSSGNQTPFSILAGFKNPQDARGGGASMPP